MSSKLSLPIDRQAQRVETWTWRGGLWWGWQLRPLRSCSHSSHNSGIRLPRHCSYNTACSHQLVRFRLVEGFHAHTLIITKKETVATSW